MAEPPILELLLPCAGAILSKNVMCVDFQCVMQGVSWRLTVVDWQSMVVFNEIKVGLQMMAQHAKGIGMHHSLCGSRSAVGGSGLKLGICSSSSITTMDLELAVGESKWKVKP